MINKITIVFCMIALVIISLTLGYGVGYNLNDCPNTKVISARCPECPKLSAQDCINLTRNSKYFLEQIKNEVIK